MSAMLFPQPPWLRAEHLDEGFSIPCPKDANLDWLNPPSHHGTCKLLGLPGPPHTLFPILGCSHSLWVTHTIRLSPVLNHHSNSFNLNSLHFALPGTDLPGHGQNQAAGLLHRMQAGLHACLCFSQHLPLWGCDSVSVLSCPPQGSLKSSHDTRFCLRLVGWFWFLPEQLFLWSSIWYKSVLRYCRDEHHGKNPKISIEFDPLFFYTRPAGDSMLNSIPSL